MLLKKNKLILFVIILLMVPFIFQELYSPINRYFLTKKYYNFRHTPHPIRKSTFENYFKKHPEVFIENIKYKFR